MSAPTYRPRRGRDGDRRSGAPEESGSITAEFACGLLTAAVVVVFLIWAIGLTMLRIACIDTANEVARQVARGDKSMAQAAIAKAPSGAAVHTKSHGQFTVVTVEAWSGRLGRLAPSIKVTASAQALKEPGE